MFLCYPGVVGLSSRDAIAHSIAEQLFDGTLIKQFLVGILIQTPTHTAQGIGDLVVHPMHILDLDVLTRHCRHPSVSNSVQVGHCHDIGQRVIVGPYKEGLILQILPKLFGHGPFQSQELQFRRVILQLASLEALTGIGYRMIMAVDLLLGEHCPQSLYWCVGLQQERLLEVRECQHRHRETLHLKLLERCEGVWWQTKRVRLKLAVLFLK